MNESVVSLNCEDSWHQKNW